MAVEEDTTGKRLRLADPEIDVGTSRRELRHMHHMAADELLEDAINLLALLELYGHVDDEFPADAKAVAAAASVIIEKLVRALSHHREALP
jgi:hypothetical protein